MTKMIRFWAILVLMSMSITVTVIEGNDRVEFIAQPHDVYVVVGEDAFFPCAYNGSNIAPSWNINGKRVSSSDIELPKHSYNGTGLIVQNTDLSHHLWRYSCFFTVYSQDSRAFVNYQSSTGTLHIQQQVTSSNSIMHNHVVTVTVTTIPLVFSSVKPTKALLPLSSVTIMSSAPSHHDTGVIIGIATSGTFVVIIVFITTLLIIIIMKKKVASRSTLEEEIRKPAQVDPVYEEVLPDTNVNPCYEIIYPKVKFNNIEMSSNAAYAVLNK